MWNLMQSRRVRWSVVHLMTASLVALSLPATPGKAAVLDDLFDRIFGSGPNPYRQCATDLSRAGVQTTTAADACSQALRPDDLGVCVRRITTNQVSGTDALDVCRNVRRPIEAATCVTDINRRTSQTQFRAVLDSCRRSLLPERFSQCVIGINRDLNLPTDQAINICIDASDRPRDVSTITPSPISPVVPSPSTNTPAPSTTNPVPSPTTPGTTPTPGTSTPAPPTTTPGTVTPQRN